MPVKFYEFGKLVGGSSSGGASAPAESMYGPAQSFSGVLPVGDTVINFLRATKSVQVWNTSDSVAFQVSSDPFADWITVGTYGNIRENIMVNSITLRAAVAGASYFVLAVLTE